MHLDPIQPPLVSVVMIFLDEKDFIEEAVESVLAQTYANWELLFVDDGSMDGSTQIARRYTERLPAQIRYLEHAEHQNRGMSASRNLGIQHASGEFLALLDADDVWLPHKLEQQVAILREHPEAAMVFGPTHQWYGWTRRPEDARRDFVQELGIEPNTLVPPPTVTILALQNEGRSPRTCSVLMRREVVKRIGGFEDRFRGLYEDQAFFSKLCLRYPVFVTDPTGDKYRQHKNGSCAVAVRSGQYHAARRQYLDWLAVYLSERGPADKRLREVLENERWPYRHPLLHSISRRFRPLFHFARAMTIPMARILLPPALYRWLQAKWSGSEYCPPVGRVRFGSLRRLTPISRDFGFDRGLPIDRFYIERFLDSHASDIRGHVLEMGDDTYTQRFGNGRVIRADVLHVNADNPKATIVADLTTADQIASESFDCVICVQTLQFIYDARAALRTLHRILKPGGVLLATVSGISQLSRDEWRNSWHWNFTTQSIRRAAEENFSPAQVEVAAHGNVLVAMAFLHGLATEELTPEELEHRDSQYECLITLRAVKSPK